MWLFEDRAPLFASGFFIPLSTDLLFGRFDLVHRLAPQLLRHRTSLFVGQLSQPFITDVGSGHALAHIGCCFIGPRTSYQSSQFPELGRDVVSSQ